jgi:hypothetical protein
MGGDNKLIKFFLFGDLGVCQGKKVLIFYIRVSGF